MGYSYGYGYGHTWRPDKRQTTAAAAAVGGGALLVGEVNGWATDFLYATDASRVALKASSALTYYPVDGFYQNAGTSPKMVYDVAGVLGWSPHNLLPRSDDFNLYFALTGVTLAKNAIGPFGGANTAFTLAATAGAGVKNMQTDIGGSVVGLCFSIYAKAGTANWIALESVGDPTGNGAYFNLAAGTVGTTNGSITSNATITAIGGGWYRCSVRLETYTYFAASPHTSDNQSWNWTATGSETVLIASGQINRGYTPLAYLPTTTAARVGLALDYDSVTHAAKGLLCEPQATNSMRYSNSLSTGWTTSGFTVAQNATGPLGANTAWTLTCSAGSAAKWTYMDRYGAGNYRYSVYAKVGTLNWIALGDGTAGLGNVAFFNVSAGTVGTVAGRFSAAAVEPVGNGWYRCSATVTAAGDGYIDVSPHSADNQLFTWTATGGETVLVSAFQAEIGTVATSYIPTLNATVTRAEDIYGFTSASINYSATAGSWWMDATPTAPAGYRIVGFANGTAAPAYTQSATVLAMYDGTFTQKTVANTFAAHKMAAAYAAGDRAFTADGLTVQVDVGSTTNLLNPGNIGLGSIPGVGTSTGNMYLRKVRYLPRRKTNLELVTETT